LIMGLQMNKNESEKLVLPPNRDVNRLRRRVGKLACTKSQVLTDAICDIIDLRGCALAVLLAGVPRLPPRVQKEAAAKIEDLLFFHPNRGRKVMSRLINAVKKSDISCRPHFIAAMADVVARSGKKWNFQEDLSEEAAWVLDSDADFMRKGKAVEIISYANRPDYLPKILKSMRNAFSRIENYANYHFTEACLFALKHLGGEGLLRLIINPNSPDANQQFRIQWREKDASNIRDVLAELQQWNEDLAQLVLKVVDLSEFNVHFTAMIHQGLKHTDKWVRQIATASVAKVGADAGFENLGKMLADPASEVRLMAVGSLGNYPADISGSLLIDIALKESESLDLRLNALYALFMQKNRAALEKLVLSPTLVISINAKGLASLLMPREKGLKNLLDSLDKIPGESFSDCFHYLMELALPEDLPELMKTHKTFSEGRRGNQFIDFLAAFLRNKAGPTLDKVISTLDLAEQSAIKVIQKGHLGELNT